LWGGVNDYDNALAGQPDSAFDTGMTGFGSYRQKAADDGGGHGRRGALPAPEVHGGLPSAGTGGSAGWSRVGHEPTTRRTGVSMCVADVSALPGEPSAR
ncbi:hypothetical protein AB0F16_05630, partial [Streptomyces tanashiensis]|uniref:hypothetical protein n=1 Tax=Streptomyces tanashiensis TaxID=67367 RepID=UPI0033C70E0D